VERYQVRQRAAGLGAAKVPPAGAALIPFEGVAEASDTTAVAEPLLAPGTVLAEKYRLGRVLGEGGMARVYEAVHTGLGTPVALKLLHGSFAKDAEIVDRFAREARAAARLDSPHIARVLDVDTTSDGRPFLTMELLVGADLSVALEDLGVLPVDTAVDVIVQAARGIHVAHAAGIVHRDLKPENLFICTLGPQALGRGLVKILDFGIAKDKRAEASRMTTPGTIFGTVFYMAPEQIRSAQAADARTDVWALGAILYELLAGRPPFEGDAHSVVAQIVADPIPPLRPQRAEISAELEAVVMRALERDVTKRFPTADALARALAPWAPRESVRELVARLPPESIPKVPSIDSLVPRPEPASEPTNRGWATLPHGTAPSRSRAFVIAGAVAVALVVVLGIALTRSETPRSSPPASASAITPPPEATTSETAAATTTTATATAPTTSAETKKPVRRVPAGKPRTTGDSLPARL